MPRRIAFINEKGGSGKTTLVANIACHLASARGHRVLAIDMDPQGQLGKVLGLDVRRSRRSSIELLVNSVLGEGGDGGPESLDLEARDDLPTLSTRFPQLDVVVANKSLALFPTWAGMQGEDPTLRLAESLAKIPAVESYDFVLIDSPPSFGALTLNVLRACNEVVIPVPLTFLALDGCAELLRSVELVQERYGNRELQVTMVIPTFARRTRMAQEILEKLKHRFPKEIAHAVVGFHVKIDEAQSRGLTVFEHAPADRGAKLMAALAEELDARGRPDFAPELVGAGHTK